MHTLFPFLPWSTPDWNDTCQVSSIVTCRALWQQFYSSTLLVSQEIQNQQAIEQIGDVTMVTKCGVPSFLACPGWTSTAMFSVSGGWERVIDYDPYQRGGGVIVYDQTACDGRWVGKLAHYLISHCHRVGWFPPTEEHTEPRRCSHSPLSSSAVK